jgi:RNA polymerase sigma factor (sigma-70 family)
MSNNTQNNNNNNNNGNTTMTINEMIFATYTPLLTTMTIRLNGNSELAHDIVMDTIAKAIDNSDKYDASKGANVKTWVQTIAYRVLTDYYRSHAVSRTSGGYTSVELDAFAGGYDVDYDGVSVEATDFWGTVQSLTNDKEYGILIRRFRDDMSYVEIAADMGIPKGSVMSGLSNAKKKLRESNSFVGMFQ